jgi:hypothetical protein
MSRSAHPAASSPGGCCTAKHRREQEKTPADSETPREFNPQPDTANAASGEMKPYPVEIWEGT